MEIYMYCIKLITYFSCDNFLNYAWNNMFFNEICEVPSFTNGFKFKSNG